MNDVKARKCGKEGLGGTFRSMNVRPRTKEPDGINDRLVENGVAGLGAQGSAPSSGKPWSVDRRGRYIEAQEEGGGVAHWEGTQCQRDLDHRGPP